MDSYGVFWTTLFRSKLSELDKTKSLVITTSIFNNDRKFIILVHNNVVNQAPTLEKAQDIYNEILTYHQLKEIKNLLTPVAHTLHFHRGKQTWKIKHGTIHKLQVNRITTKTPNTNHSSNL